MAASPLELYPDEAQYWLWSRTLAFGYFSKPPMIAWLIAASTAVAGNMEFGVRVLAPLTHAATTLIAFYIGRRLYGPWAGAAGAALYILAPAVQLSSFVITTDAPLVMFLALTLLAYVQLPDARGRAALGWAALFGAALGLAFLSKYAALYAIGGIALHLVLIPSARRAWNWRLAGIALAAFLVLIAPNLIWNATHSFSTLAHTASNANWDARDRFRLGELGFFLASQAVIFGTFPFCMMIGGSAVLGFRRRLQTPDVLLLCLILPPLIAVSVQAFISHANANWAAAYFVPGTLLVGAFAVRWRARILMSVILAAEVGVAAAFLLVIARPEIGDSWGVGNGLKQVRGWRQITETVVERARTEQLGGPLTAVVADNRFVYNAMAYYGRDAFGHDLPALRSWVAGPHPMSQAEAEAALTPATGTRVVAVSAEAGATSPMARDFVRVEGLQINSVRLDGTRNRRVQIFLGEDFRPKPRTKPALP